MKTIILNILFPLFLLALVAGVIVILLTGDDTVDEEELEPQEPNLIAVKNGVMYVNQLKAQQ